MNTSARLPPFYPNLVFQFFDWGGIARTIDFQGFSIRQLSNSQSAKRKGFVSYLFTILLLKYINQAAHLIGVELRKSGGSI